MIPRCVVLLGVVVVVVADIRPSYSYRPLQVSGEHSLESDEVKYDFSYALNDDDSGNDFGHQEARDGDDTQGSYYVQLPDGRLQKVTYYVDGDSGYMAEVSYEGEARYPESSESREYQAPARPRYSASESQESAEAPVYAPPRPTYSPPRPAYRSPRPSYRPPRPSYRPPRPSYRPSRPSYSSPEAEESREVAVYVPYQESEESGESRVYSPPLPRYFLSLQSSQKADSTLTTHFSHPSSLNSYQPPVYIPS